MIIKSNDRFWSDEESGDVWHEVAESALSYGQVVTEPSPVIRDRIRAELEAAFDEDCPDPFAFRLDTPTPKHDAIKAKWGATYSAMRAYDDFRVACIESHDQ